MADILEFRGKSSAPSSKATASRKHVAEIVIFPGIRYERWSDTPVSGQAAMAVERDTLRLVE